MYNYVDTRVPRLGCAEAYLSTIAKDWKEIKKQPQVPSSVRFDYSISYKSLARTSVE